jgi:hypothetical protein
VYVFSRPEVSIAGIADLLRTSDDYMQTEMWKEVTKGIEQRKSMGPEF